MIIASNDSMITTIRSKQNKFAIFYNIIQVKKNQTNMLADPNEIYFGIYNQLRVLSKGEYLVKR